MAESLSIPATCFVKKVDSCCDGFLIKYGCNPHYVRMRGMVMLVRLAHKDDIGAISNLINRNFDEVISNFHSGRVIGKFKEYNSKDNLAKQLLWKKVYVAEDNGEIVGTGAFANLSDNVVPKYSLSNLYVLPEKHHQGIGRCIFHVLKNDAVKQKTKSFHVPSTRNGAAFCEKMGFVVDAVQLDLEDEITWMTMKL